MQLIEKRTGEQHAEVYFSLLFSLLLLSLSLILFLGVIDIYRKNRNSLRLLNGLTG